MSRLLASTLFSFFLFVFFALFALEASTFSRLAQFFPYYISIAGAVLSFIYTTIQIRELVKNKKVQEELATLNMKRPLKYLAWLIGYVVLIYVLGIIVASILFLASFLYIESKFTVLKTAMSISIVVVGLLLFSNVMNLYWPNNLVGF
ncbi:tripartite tricarboxylate transporter TctB family protein [Alkalihalophilus lindianensis]|uniref:Tripartite tricarboxylate transporter TctB family protein n=1 Tax=Alkalihalophilus lindianensis TaxID=1630542 RepID=A0ABU3XE11_9BACI|nr:tripartite tricarboxylate transporter TctB family protein [Alkalihalophilus lindianensis]MDV2686123.1 tripartite tricarboxylate transporter TctB family protein [Alkalihalophilus lindianensis]